MLFLCREPPLDKKLNFEPLLPKIFKNLFYMYYSDIYYEDLIFCVDSPLPYDKLVRFLYGRTSSLDKKINLKAFLSKHRNAVLSITYLMIYFVCITYITKMKRESNILRR